MKTLLRLCPTFKVLAVFVLCCAPALQLRADSEVVLKEVPSYNWQFGCFGTGTGILIGYWDRHGFPDFYTGPTSGGVAPLNNSGANAGIRALWASQAGFDGRPANQPGHLDDYWSYFDFTGTDPYIIAGRAEHEPDCIGDFIGLNQKKWTNMNDECDGNIDGYAFNYWDTSGNKRTNYVPTADAGLPTRDIQSGLRAWTQYRGYDAEIVTQLQDKNRHCPEGKGFTFEDYKTEIDAGYPVLFMLQDLSRNFQSLTNPVAMPKANADIHAVVGYGYADYPAMGIKWAYFQTSWGSEANGQWDGSIWLAGLPVRGVICFHPQPKIKSTQIQGTEVTISWEGADSVLYDNISQTSTNVSHFQVERSVDLNPPVFVPIGSVTTDHQTVLTESGETSAFYRIQMVR